MTRRAKCGQVATAILSWRMAATKSTCTLQAAETTCSSPMGWKQLRSLSIDVEFIQTGRNSLFYAPMIKARVYGLLMLKYLDDILENGRKMRRGGRRLGKINIKINLDDRKEVEFASVFVQLEHVIQRAGRTALGWNIRHILDSWLCFEQTLFYFCSVLLKAFLRIIQSTIRRTPTRFMELPTIYYVIE